MEYVGFLFIPIIAVDNNLSLSQVAIISAIMWFPSILNSFLKSGSAESRVYYGFDGKRYFIRQADGEQQTGQGNHLFHT